MLAMSGVKALLAQVIGQAAIDNELFRKVAQLQQRMTFLVQIG